VPINVVKLMHVGVRVDPEDEVIRASSDFYSGLLGLETDVQRPEIPGIPGFWVNVNPGDRGQQVHVMGARGASPVSRSDKHDPTRGHMAFTVEDIGAARDELTSRSIEFWEYGSLVGDSSLQIFFEDPSGNVIELQQHQD